MLPTHMLCRSCMLQGPEARDIRQRATGSFSNALKANLLVAPSGASQVQQDQHRKPQVSSCLLCYLQHLLSSGDIRCNSQVAFLFEHELQKPPAQGILCQLRPLIKRKSACPAAEASGMTSLTMQ